MKRFAATKLGLFRSLLVVLFVLPSADTALAYSIEEVSVLPAGEITSNDPVTLEVFIVTPHSPPYLHQPSEVAVTGTDILVDIFPESGNSTMIDSFTVTVDIGTLQPGTYEYEIDLHPLRTKNWGIPWATGSFSVVQGPPIPTLSAWGLLAMTLLLVTMGTLALRRRRVV